MSEQSAVLLSALEARVLGVLIEKEHTVPDTYPLSLNALVSGCNQKTSRDPLMNIGEAEVLSALDRLKSLSLAVESSGSRVMRYAHNTGRVLQVPSAAVTLLATLMLRGPQTAAEIRSNGERLHRFADVSAVEGYLHELAGRAPEPLVVELPRQPGARENRWMHLLCGAPTLEAAGSLRAAGGGSAGGSSPDGGIAALAARIAVLEEEVAALKRVVERRGDTERRHDS